MLAGTLEDGVHRLQVRVYYEDTDFSGIVYHANYLRFCERGRTDMLRLAGVDQGALLAGEGLSFAVRRITADFIGPARIDDVLTVETRVASLRGASLVMAQAVQRDRDPLFALEAQVALLNAVGRPARFPPALKDALATALGDKGDSKSDGS